MIEPIFERLLSYQKIASKKIKKIFGKLFFFIKNINQYLLLNLKKIKYSFELRREYYYLGKYLSKLGENKYDLSHDKVFINYIEKIKLKKNLINKNDDDLSTLSIKQESNI